MTTTPKLRGFVRRVSEGEGHEVREAGDGLEGINAHRHRPADLILCDLFMPRKEGLETIRQLTTEFPGLKIVAMSGGIPHVAGPTLLQMAKLLGAVDVLDKPLDRKTLVASMRAALQV